MKPKVLILDDEAAIGRSLSRTLRHAGFEVIATTDADEASAVLRSSSVAVIVCDQRMPKIEGVAFLARCAVESPATVRILLTGYADAQVAAEAVNKAQVFRLLWKPWADSEIVEAVRQAAWIHAENDDVQEDEVTPISPLDPPMLDVVMGRNRNS